jgi:hypothetical protein
MLGGLMWAGWASVSIGAMPVAPPIIAVNDTEQTERQRLAAVDELWAEVQGGTGDRAAAREALKRIVWRGGDPPTLRIRAIDVLTSDTDAAGRADAVTMLRLRLPTETNWDVLGHICELAGKNGWVELTPALVRSYARRVAEPPDNERPERNALLALYPGKSIVSIVYEVFATPATGEGVAKDMAEKARGDAWALLGRLDVEGSERAKLLADADAAAASDPLLADLVATARDLGVVAVTASELQWARGLRSGKDPLDAAWWEESKAAVAMLTAQQREGLAMRHVEPVRWSAKHKPSWLGKDRAGLLDELSERIGPRKHSFRQAEEGDAAPGVPERLDAWRDKLVWGDVLAMLVVDEALKDPGVRAAFVKQIETDIRDTSTEHGGVLRAVASDGTRFEAEHFPPRPTQRVGDTRFVASDEMVKASGRALAQYHFHAQRWENRDYSGPGPGDMEYATEHGHNCLVLTPTRRGMINVDFYQRGGAVIDLGGIELPK